MALESTKPKGTDESNDLNESKEEQDELKALEESNKQNESKENNKIKEINESFISTEFNKTDVSNEPILPKELNETIESNISKVPDETNELKEFNKPNESNLSDEFSDINNSGVSSEINISKEPNEYIEPIESNLSNEKYEKIENKDRNESKDTNLSKEQLNQIDLPNETNKFTDVSNEPILPKDLNEPIESNVSKVPDETNELKEFNKPNESNLSDEFSDINNLGVSSEINISKEPNEYIEPIESNLSNEKYEKIENKDRNESKDTNLSKEQLNQIDLPNETNKFTDVSNEPILPKELNEPNISKESNEPIELKESNVPNEPNVSKELIQTKELNEPIELKESKESKESKEPQNDEKDKPPKNSCDCFSGENYIIGFASCIGRRPSNEDSYIIIPPPQMKQFQRDPSVLYNFNAIFDGHAGFSSAKYCATKFPKTFFEQKNWEDDPETAMQNSIQKIDQILLNNHVKSGSTALISLQIGKKIIVANVGDSRSILSSKRIPVEMSIDHKPHFYTEKKRIESTGGIIARSTKEYENILKEQNGDFFSKLFFCCNYDYCFSSSLEMGIPRVFPGGLALSRSIGDSTIKDRAASVISEPEFKTREITELDEFIVLACDGVWDVLSNEQVVENIHSVLAGNQSSLTELQRCNLMNYCPTWNTENIPKEVLDNELAQKVLFAAQNIVEQSIVLGSTDNITVIIILLEDFIKKLLFYQDNPDSTISK